MRTSVNLLLLMVVLPTGVANAAQSQARDVQPTIPILELISSDDYPVEALSAGHQGSVRVRLAVGPDGLVKGCAVAESSGYESLDSNTCRILIERARFSPARDDRGRAIDGEYTQRVSWRTGDDPPPPRVAAAIKLLVSCVNGEVAKLVTSGLPAEEVLDRAFPPCAPLEALLVREVELAQTEGETDTDAGTKFLADLKARARIAIPQGIARERETLTIK